MNEYNNLPDGTPIASFEDVIDFLEKRATLPCSACGHWDWSVFSSREVKGIQGGMGVVGMQLHSGATFAKGVPVVITTCKKCFYMRMHNFDDISKWVTSGKPEFPDAPEEHDE
jgi:hypothetical protein